MIPRDLLKAAHDLVRSSNGKPRDANLRRATSSAYYALFHTLSKSCADLMIGGSGSSRSKPAWHQVYRALEHNAAKAACQNSATMAKFPKEIQDFANMFVVMQEKRHRADYDPFMKAYKSAVLNDLRAAENVIDGFELAPIRDRRAFAAWVLFKKR